MKNLVLLKYVKDSSLNKTRFIDIRGNKKDLREFGINILVYFNIFLTFF
jgi:hypothetical protein